MSDSRRQMAFVLWFQDEETTNLHVLNGLMTNGWKFISSHAMSGTGDQKGVGSSPQSRTLIILENPHQ